METVIDHAVMSKEACVVQRLRECGESSLEELTQLSSLDWATVFPIIDRFSRTGFVVLKRNGVDYRVALEKRI